MATDFLAQLEALERARTSGILTVEYDGRRVTYRSDAELAAAIAYCRQQLGQPRITTVLVQTSKGF